MISAALLFAVMGLLVKIATQVQNVPPMQVVFMRSAVTLVLLAPYMWVRGVPLIGKNKIFLMTRGLAGFAALALNFYVTSRIKLADSSLLNNTSVFFTVLFSAIFLRERISKGQIYWIMTAFAGVLFILKPTPGLFQIDGVWGVLSGVFAAIAYISIRKLHITESNNTIVLSFAFFSTFLPLILWGHTFVITSWFSLLVLIGVGLVGTVAQVLLTASYKYEQASVVNPYTFTTVLFSALLGYLLFDEVQDLLSLVGAVIVVVSGIYLMRYRNKPQI